MKKLMIIFVCGLLFTVVSCRKDDISDGVIVEQKLVNDHAAKALLSWTYYPYQTWSFSNGIGSLIGCWSDHGTNYSSNRAVVTVSSDGSSTGTLIAEVFTRTNCTRGLSPVFTLTIGAGQSKTGHVLLTGNTDSKIVVYIRPSSGLMGSYSGQVLYGYEY